MKRAYWIACERDGFEVFQSDERPIQHYGILLGPFATLKELKAQGREYYRTDIRDARVNIREINALTVLIASKQGGY